jgi:hypothetical protein
LGSTQGEGEKRTKKYLPSTRRWKKKKNGRKSAGIVIEILVGTYEQVVVGYRQPSQPNKYINK